MTVFRNGFWSATAAFHDKGEIAGDFFFVELLLDKVHSVGARLEGSILDPQSGRNLSLSQDGADRWIRENWSKFEASGPSVRLHAAVAAGVVAGKTAGIVLLIVGAVVVMAIGGIFLSHNTRVSRCPGPPERDEHGRPIPCVEFSPAPEGDPN
jgi:hypothetical protein